MQVCRDAMQDEASYYQGLIIPLEFYYATGHWFIISTVDVDVTGIQRVVTAWIRSSFIQRYSLLARWIVWWSS